MLEEYLSGTAPDGEAGQQGGMGGARLLTPLQASVLGGIRDAMERIGLPDLGLAERIGSASASSSSSAPPRQRIRGRRRRRGRRQRRGWRPRPPRTGGPAPPAPQTQTQTQMPKLSWAAGPGPGHQHQHQNPVPAGRRGAGSPSWRSSRRSYPEGRDGAAGLYLNRMACTMGRALASEMAPLR